jgi:hypothetical protein
MKHLKQTLATYVYNYCNICNIHMKHLQYTSRTSETIEIYICNIGGRDRGPVDSGRQGVRWRRATPHEHHWYRLRSWVPLGKGRP